MSCTTASVVKKCMGSRMELTALGNVLAGRKARATDACWQATTERRITHSYHVLV
jgi:hypothetical protein